MKTFTSNDLEVNFEVHTSVEELQTLINRVKEAAKNAQRGQVLRAKIAHNVCIVIEDLGVAMPTAKPVVGSLAAVSEGNNVRL